MIPFGEFCMKYLNYIIFFAIVFIISGCERVPEGDLGFFLTQGICSYDLNTEQITGHGQGDLYSNYSPFGDYYIYINSYESYISIRYRGINTNEFFTIVDSLQTSYLYSNKVVTYSNDGQMITFSTDSIYTVNVDGTNLKSHTVGNYPTFSPDDSKLLYVNGEGYLSTKNIENNMITELLYDEEIIFPIFHPDGNKIYYFNDRAIIKYSISDSSSTLIATLPVVPHGYIKFSESGDHKLILAYMSYTLDENDSINLVDDVKYYGDISPDGTKIAYSYETSLWLMDFDGSNKVYLSSTYLDENNIFFTKDSTKIFFNVEIGI